MGLGADSRGGGGGGNDYGRQRDVDRNFVPPTMEEVRRTIFVAGLDDGTPEDSQVEQVLACGGAVRLRTWTRLLDADGHPCTFGFAEYEDANSLHLVSEIFKDGAVELPLRDKSASRALVKNEDGELKKAKLKVSCLSFFPDYRPRLTQSTLQIYIDEKSTEYIEQWSKSKISDEELHFKLDTAREDLTACLKRLESLDTLPNPADVSRDTVMADSDADILNISVPAAAAGAQEDELSDIPADMRETVAAEIKAFRQRSLQRDLERLRKEDELEAAERLRSGPRAFRLASPPPSSAPSGPNGAPLGPRSSVVAGAPQGPKGYRGAQMPKDYADGVAFTNGADHHEEDDDSASDDELERRRDARKKEDLDKIYLDQERRWLNVERRHIASLARAEAEEASEKASQLLRREALAAKFREFDDEEELRRPVELFYRDRKTWRRARAEFRRKERDQDARDRFAEEKELGHEQRRLDDARGMADDFLSQTAQDLSRSRPNQRAGFSLNLSGSANNTHPDRRIADNDAQDESGGRVSRGQRMQDMENLLDDSDDIVPEVDRKPLRQLDLKPLAPGERMSDEQRLEATRQLASSIPNETAALFAWPIKWEHLTSAVIDDQLRPYVQKKIFESLGVQEDMLVEIIEGVVRDQGRPERIVEELSGLLDEEAEGLARKVWRMVVFFSEAEAMGLGTAGTD